MSERKPAMPFGALFLGDLRAARMALRDPRTDPALRAELERYLANPLKATVRDSEQLVNRANQEADAAEKAAAELRGAHRSGRKDGTPNKKTARLEAVFDKLLAANPDCTVEDIHKYKIPKSVGRISRATVARHWKKAKERAAK